MGTHPIFESDFDCLTEQKPDYNMAYSVSTKKIVRKRTKKFHRHQADRFMRVDKSWKNQSVLTPVFAVDSRANTLCHQLVMVPRPVTVTDVPTKRTSRSLSLTTLPSWKF